MKKMLLVLFLMINIFVKSEMFDYKLLNKEEGQEEIVKNDSYLNSIDDKNIEIILKRKGNIEDLKNVMKNDVIEWSYENKIKIDEAMDRAIKNLSKFHNLPNVDNINIVLIEGDSLTAPHTRQKTIYMTREILENETEDVLLYIMVHEIYHIYSRIDKNWSNEIYKLFGFEKYEKLNIDELNKVILSNPDALTIEHAINLEINGEKILLTPIWYFDNIDVVLENPNNNLISYTDQGLLEVYLENNKLKPKYDEDNELKIYSYIYVDEFFEVVGANTYYLVHPEEITAENFTHTVLMNDENYYGTGYHNILSPEKLDELEIYLMK